MGERHIAPGRVLAVMEGDITKVAADASVNAANSAFAHGGGSGTVGVLRFLPCSPAAGRGHARRSSHDRGDVPARSRLNWTGVGRLLGGVPSTTLAELLEEGMAV